MIEFIIIVEAEADFSIASEIAERIIVEQVDWIQDYLDVNMQWRGLQEETRYTCWKHIRNIIQKFIDSGFHYSDFSGKGRI